MFSLSFIAWCLFTFSTSMMSIYAVCGPGTDTTCVSTFNLRSSHTLVDCLTNETTFPSAMDTNVNIVEWFNGAFAGQKYPGVFKLTFPQVDFENFTKANFNAALGQPRFPAGIFYAESQEEVINAVNCARDAGYKVSPRGRGHSYQGLSSMDGYLVIDMSLMCEPEEFVDTYFDDEPWLLGGGQKAIGSIKSGAGCTNAVMLAYTNGTFPDGIYLIGSCPTVGITGKYHCKFKLFVFVHTSYLCVRFFTFRLTEYFTFTYSTFHIHNIHIINRLCNRWRSRRYNSLGRFGN